MSLDIDLLKEAKQKFFEDFGKQIRDLGYHLAHGITSVDDSLAIMAKVQDDKNSGFPDVIREQIEGILPQKYFYKGQEIPVAIQYSGLAHFE